MICNENRQGNNVKYKLEMDVYRAERTSVA